MLEDEYRAKLTGTVEMDETFIGGKIKNMHKSKRPKGTGTAVKQWARWRKQSWSGCWSEGPRAGRSGTRAHAAIFTIRYENVDPGSALMTDEWGGYKGVNYEHAIINHAVEYVHGLVHTQGIENFWSLLKTGTRWNICQCRAFSSFPVHRRTGIPVQQQEVD